MLCFDPWQILLTLLPGGVLGIGQLSPAEGYLELHRSDSSLWVFGHGVATLLLQAGAFEEEMIGPPDQDMSHHDTGRLPRPGHSVAARRLARSSAGIYLGDSRSAPGSVVRMNAHGSCQEERQFGTTPIWLEAEESGTSSLLLRLTESGAEISPTRSVVS